LQTITYNVFNLYRVHGGEKSSGKPYMGVTVHPSEMTVLILFNLDPAWSSREQADVFDVTSSLGKEIDKAGYKTSLVPVTMSDLDLFLSAFNPSDTIVFNWCENLPGMHNSEWMVAKYLEDHDFTFTGSPSATIALAQDKPSVKKLLDSNGILTPAWALYRDTENVRWNRFPAIVKPSQEHCSEGIDRDAVVFTRDDLMERIRYIMETYREPVMVEDFIDGREMHVSLWGNGRIAMLPPAEMDFSSFSDQQDRLCSYEAKFIPDSRHYQDIKTVLPAPLEKDELRDVEQACTAAYSATGCRDYARIDLRIKDELVYILDVNPNCDISPDTSTISAAEYAGYSYGEFGSHVVRMAEQRYAAWRKQAVLEVPPLPRSNPPWLS